MLSCPLETLGKGDLEWVAWRSGAMSPIQPYLQLS